MENLMEGLAPARLFDRFAEISAIPRPSGKEDAISGYLLDFAHSRGLEAERDDLFNVIIKKPGSFGCENLPAVMLQGHTDMVCEKNASITHDFETDGLRLKREGDLLQAEGTTLGADNGVAVALMLALLDDGALTHPPLECVFTVQEETGLAGAIGLDGSKISARIMINLDSEDEGVATVSCAGGMRTRFRRDCLWLPAEGLGLRIRIRGLLGGHSGCDIHLERGNANKLMGRVLYAVYENVQFKLGEINGGGKDNAIPRESEAVIMLPNEAALDAAIHLMEKEADAISAELTEPDFCVDIEPCQVGRVMDDKSGQAVLRLLMLAPNGVQNRNVGQGGFVVRSLNLGVLQTDASGITAIFAPRSSVSSLQKQMKRELSLLGDALGFAVSIDSEYPGWAYAEDSTIRNIFCECYKELTGKELRCEAIHAGLECGLFLEKLPGLDAIAIGPQINNCHTPSESLVLSSLSRCYELVASVLSRLTKQ